MKSTVRYSVILIAVLAASFTLSGADNMVNIYGPQKYVRSTGQPVTIANKFLLPAGVNAPFDLDVWNGTPYDGTGGSNDNAVTSGTITLNGAVIFSPPDFKKNVKYMTKTVTLNPSNTLQVTLESKPGSFIYVSVVGNKAIVDTTKPQLSIDNAQSTITNKQSITVSGTVTDQSAVTLTVDGTTVPATNGSFSTSVNLVEGTNIITAVATDAHGNQTTQTIIVIKDSTPPTLKVNDDQLTITNEQSTSISGTVVDSTSVTLMVNGQNVFVSNGSFNATVSLIEGLNTITIVATDAAGNSAASTRTVRLETTSPALIVSSPQDSLLTNQGTLTVSGTVSDSTAVAVKVNGNSVPMTNGTFGTTLGLAEGMNVITIAATNAAGNTTRISRTARMYTIPPTVAMTSPSDSLITNKSQVQVSGTVSDSVGVTVQVNGSSVPVTNGSFSTTCSFVEGMNMITITATDGAGNINTIKRIIRLYTIAPVITIQSPQDSSTTYDSTVTINGTIADSTRVTMTINGNPVSVNSDGSFSAMLLLVTGANQINVSVTDAAGNMSSKELSITRSNIILPPDPATVAPKIDQTVVTTVGAATKFLYTGLNPIQSGVDTSMMNYVRSAAIRGKVLQRNGQPLPGVTMSILGHPEFGQTLSRADGMYDMAINGGGQLTVNYAMTGYLTAQRQVNAPWQSFANVDSVDLVQLDPKVTVVELGSDSISVARGSTVTDQSGTRQATLLFKPGTQATMKIVNYTYDTLTSGGSTQIIKVPTDTATVSLDSLSVRATEYTVGVNGPQAMPAALPPTSAYTYCVELSSDEAITAGASTVEFTKPVVDYLDNFLNIPPGYAVPVGYYDKSQGQWIAMQDGVVLKIIDTTGGDASIDFRGNGVAASRTSLDSLGIDSLEQRKLASIYSPGQTLWRVQLNHFSILDLNFAYVLVGNSTPNNEDLDGANLAAPLNVKNVCSSIIGVQTQSLGQAIDITGTPFALHYNSNYALGFKQANTLNLPLTGSSLPGGLLGVDLKVSVAGQQFNCHFDTARNLNYKFAWNGKDCYGRVVQGDPPVDVSIGFDYKLERVAVPISKLGMSTFSQMVGTTFFPIVGFGNSSSNSPVWRNWHSKIGGFQAATEGLGCWTLSVHHKYDPDLKKIYYGDGKSRDASLISSLTDVFQVGSSDYTWIAIAADGAIYYSQTQSFRVWKRCTDGSIVLVAGTGSRGRSGDGGPATQASLGTGQGLAVGPDGSVYISDQDNECIRRVDPSGIITTFAGGQYGYSGDGGLAVNARLSNPAGLAVGPDGSLYIADQSTMLSGKSTLLELLLLSQVLATIIMVIRVMAGLQHKRS